MKCSHGEARELKERVVEINRVAKVVKGGRRFSFTALVVIGDEVDHVGVGYGKAREVPLAISKAVDDAKKNLFAVPKHGTTITHEIARRVRRRARAAPPGERGNRRHRRRRRPRRARARRIRDILAKSLGTTNPINMAKATVDGLQRLRRPEDVARARGLTIARVLPYRAPQPEPEPTRSAPAERAEAPSRRRAVEAGAARSRRRRADEVADGGRSRGGAGGEA